MPNVLTNLAADMFRAADVVGREVTGFIAGSTINAGSQTAAVGQTVRSHFTRRVTPTDITPSMTIPEGVDQTIDNKTLTLTKQRGLQIPWTGEEIAYVNGGAGYETIYGDQLEQAMRAIANEVEADLAEEAYKNASRAFGVAGTTPFGSNFNEVANLRKMLVDNGCPVTDGRVSLVLDTTAGVNLRNLASLQTVNTSGNDRLLRQGELLDLQGMSIKESAQVVAHAKGAGASYLANVAKAVGDTTLALDGGTVNTTGFKAGDIVTFAADTANRYVVNTGLTATAGNIVIGGPGLRTIIPDNNAATIGDSYRANVAFHQTALELAIRAPANPLGGDAARDTIIVQDPRTGLSFLVSFYVGYHKAMIEVAAVWGYKAWKPEHIVTLLG